MFLVLPLVGIFFFYLFDCVLYRWRRLFDGLLLIGRVGFLVPVLTTVCLHVLGESKPFTTLWTLEGLLTCVKKLMLLEQAAVFEGFTADVAEERTCVVCVSAAVVLHDGVMFENHAALRAFVGLEGAVTSLVTAQGCDVWKYLIALLACKHLVLGMGHHVLSDRHFKLEVLTTQGAVVRLFSCIGAVMFPQFEHRKEQTPTFGTFKVALIFRLHLLLWNKEHLLLLLMFVFVFNEATPVLKGKAAFFTGEWREVILLWM